MRIKFNKVEAGRGGFKIVAFLLSLAVAAQLLMAVGCSSVGAGSSSSAPVKRGEFNTLSKRVDNLEYAVSGLTGQSLPQVVSSSGEVTSGVQSGLDTLAPSSPPPAAPVAPPPSAVGDLLPPAAQAPAAPAAKSGAVKASGGEKQLYQQGQNYLKRKQYDRAASVFSQMLNENPQGQLAPNARYWLGECHYASGRWGQAAGEFLRCADDYPLSAKAPDALLKLSYSYDRMGDGHQSMAALDRLLTQYPNSGSAAMIKNGQGRFSR
ncbi:tol-pal system protein YbgF [Deltaproteobacteria bacterium OttesenSCG-928-K17]|nr:tol-pal system protein YbgF [Deltaproteobacteria bacterium OttesenSCG-928-K17]